MFHSLYCDLRKHDINFFKSTRMSLESFNQLQLIRNEIEVGDTHFCQSIRPFSVQDRLGQLSFVSRD
jgi:hypothetical protein